MGCKNIEAGRDLPTGMETVDLMQDYSEAVDKSKNTKEIADLKVGVAEETFREVPHVTPDRQAEAKADVQGAEENKQFELNKHADNAEANLRPEAQKLSQLCGTQVDAGAFRGDETMTAQNLRGADSNAEGMGSETAENLSIGIGAYSSNPAKGGVGAQ